MVRQRNIFKVGVWSRMGYVGAESTDITGQSNSLFNTFVDNTVTANFAHQLPPSLWPEPRLRQDSGKTPEVDEPDALAGVRSAGVIAVP